jgi:hypothetical protein
MSFEEEHGLGDKKGLKGFLNKKLFGKKKLTKRSS